MHALRRCAEVHRQRQPNGRGERRQPVDCGKRGAREDCRRQPVSDILAERDCDLDNRARHSDANEGGDGDGCGDSGAHADRGAERRRRDRARHDRAS